MAYLLQLGKSFLNTSTIPYKLNFKSTFTILTSHLHTNHQKPNITQLCKSLRTNNNWDQWLNKRLDSLELINPIYTTGKLVEKVLLDLKEPNDAKLALKFFHWIPRQRDGFTHGVKCYCIIVHILVKGRLLIDARTLLESVLRRTREDGLIILDVLFEMYKAVFGLPFVFDLLVQSYAKLRMFEVGFNACKYLEENGVICNLISFNKLIHVVEKSDRNLMVWEIYEFMIEKRVYLNRQTVSIMISALCKEGKLQEYVEILDRIHGKRCLPAVIVNTCLIFRMIEEGRFDSGIMFLKRMLQKNIILDDVAYSLTIYARFKSGCLNLTSGQKLFEEMLRRGMSPNSFLYTLFIEAHCKEGMMDQAIRLLEEMKIKGLEPYDETFNVIIEGCSRLGRLEEGFSICEQMVKAGLHPSCSVFNELTRKLCKKRDSSRANTMLTVLLDRGFIPNEETYSYLIEGYGKEGKIQESLKLYYEMGYRSKSSPGLLTYTALIRSLCRYQMLAEAENYLSVMKDRSVIPSLTIYKMLIDNHYKKGDSKRALQLQGELNKLEATV